MTKKNEVAAANTEVAAPITDVKVLMETMKTKSAVIRHLHGLGMKVGDINKAFAAAGVKMIYQHVRNVIKQPLKKA